MATQPISPGEKEQIDEDLKRVLDEHVEAAERDSEKFSRQQIREGATKLKHPAPK